MIRKTSVLLLLLSLIMACDQQKNDMKKILFLHHSTGWNVWLGKTHRYIYKLTGKSDLRSAILTYSKETGLNCSVSEQFFPKASPYGWNNYPFDYYNIWVKHSGKTPYKDEPTLEMIAGEYDMIMFKHCFPVSNILPDTGKPDIDSDVKTLENYKLQYNALKEKMHEFPDTKFVVWTPAVQVKSRISVEEAERTRQFYDWIMNEWDVRGDNIYVWDFYKYETEGGLFMSEKNSIGPGNSHPDKAFSSKAADNLGRFVVDVLANKIK